jgi:hypothetical protein
VTDTSLPSRRRVAVTAALEGEPGADAPLRRFFWLKWSSLVAALVLVGAVALWWAWDARERRALDAEVAQWRTAGLPIRRAEFDRPAPPDDQNGAVLLSRAIGLADFGQPDIAGDVVNADAMPWPPDVMAAAQEASGRNRRLLDALRALPPRASAVWPWPAAWGSWSVDLRFDHLRHADNFLKLDAQVAAQRGEAARFLDDARAAEAVRRYLCDGPGLLPSLVGVGIGALGDSIVYEHAHHLRFTGATRAKALELVRLYLDEAGEAERFERALCSEAALGLDRATGPSLGPQWAARWMGPALRPLRAKEAARVLASTRQGILAGRARSWASAMSGMPPAPPALPAIGIDPAAAIVSEWEENVWFSPRLYVTEYRSMADRRMTAVVLACQLYAADHAGRYPKALAELVPEYLPAVPTDPFDSGHAPLGYRFDAGGRPFVYSVNQRPTDAIASGTFVPTPAAHANWRLAAYVLYVDPPPTRGPATIPAGAWSLLPMSRAATTAPAGSP